MILVTGSSGHLGEAIVRLLRAREVAVRGLDRLPSPFTDRVGSIDDPETVEDAVRGADAVIHCATLHKPHVISHARQAFIDTNITGTNQLLEACREHGVRRFVFTSTTSAFGRALVPPPGEPAAWIDEDVRPVPKNIYGATKCAAEDLCELFHRDHGIACVVLRTSRFFPEEDDEPAARDAFDGENLKLNELLYRRVDIEDAALAHLCAYERAEAIGFARYIVTATTPFSRDDCAELRKDAPSVLRRYVPDYADDFAERGWKMLSSLDRVYDNARARKDLAWAPRYDFAYALRQLRRGLPMTSELTRAVGAKGYHRDAAVIAR